MDNKLPRVFKSDISIDRTSEQDVEFIFKDIWTEGASFIHTFKLKTFVDAQFIYAKP